MEKQALKIQKKHWRENIKYEHMVAGLSGGVASTLVLHPFDLIKVRFQVNDGTVIQNRQIYKGVINAFRTIITNEGFRGLYQGVSPNIAGAASSWGLYFFSFNFFKATLKDMKGVDVLSAGNHLSAGALADNNHNDTFWSQGVSPNIVGSSLHNGIYFTVFNFLKITAQQYVSSEVLHAKDFIIIGCLTGVTTLFFTNPIWVVKTRMCLQPSVNVATTNPEYYNSVSDGLVKLFKHEGIQGYYRGFIPGILGCSHGALQFMAYEELKKMRSNYTGKSVDVKLNPLEYIVMAAVSKVFAVVVTYPYQVVRSRLQDAQLQKKYTGSLDIVQKIYRYEGFYGYYKGLAPSLLRVTPACCITFLAYENIIHFLLPVKAD